MFRDFSTVMKDATVSSVHTPTAIGNEDPKKPKAKTFPAMLGEVKAAAVTKFEIDLGSPEFGKVMKEVAARYYGSHNVAQILRENGAERAAVFIQARAEFTKRALHPNTDGETAKSPFDYDPNALSTLRPDQVPRFLGALTDGQSLPKKTVNLADLHAMQDRVDPKKVQAIADSGTEGKLAVVVSHNGKDYIADGHHRLSADWLAGKETAEVHHKDLEPVDNAMKRAPDGDPINFRIAKVDDALGMVFGWAIVCKVGGEDYYDLNIDQDGPHVGKRVPEHIPESVMMKAAAEFMQTARPGNEMHDGPDCGTYVFAFPMTTDIAKAMGIQTEKTGLMVAYKAPPDVLAKFKCGEYSGFSIEGRRLDFTEHEA